MIPDEAVEAAADIVRSAPWGYITAVEAARQILEAAAPHMLAEAWEEGFDYARNESWTPEANPYGPTR